MKFFLYFEKWFSDSMIMNKFEPLKRALICEEYVAITGHFILALILNQFIYWTKRLKDLDHYLFEENNRRMSAGSDQISMSHGWIYKNATELSEELMLDLSASTIGRYIKKLVKAKFLKTRKNPIYKYNRTLEYRVNLINVEKALVEKGYSLQGFKKPEKVHGYGNFKMKKGDVNSRNGDIQNDSCNNTEITTEIKTKTTTTECESLSVFFENLYLKFDSQAARNLIEKWLTKKDIAYVKKTIKFVNDTTNSKNSKAFLSYLSQSLEGDWSKGYMESKILMKKAESINLNEIKAIKVGEQTFHIKDETARNALGAPVYPSGMIISMINQGKAIPIYE